MFNNSNRKKIVLCIVLLLSIICLAFPQSPTYRLLVVYTDSVGKAMPNIRDYINAWAINQANTIYAQSDPGNQPLYQVQLAAIRNVHYIETYPDNDIIALLNGIWSGTGSFADLRDLRDRTSSDVVLLLHNNQHASGCAMVSSPNYYGDRYYCAAVVNYLMMQESFEAVHEIGHLMGAAHQWGNKDSTTTRAPLYAHAFAIPIGKTTIMYSFSMGSNTLPYFSNPNIAIGGFPIGKTDSAYNVKRLRENIAGIDNWRSAPSIVAVQNYTINNQEFADIQATGTININSPFTVEQGGQLNLYSGNSSLAKKRSIANDQEEIPPPNPLAASVKSFALKKVTGAIKASYTLTSNSDVTFRVFNVQGKLVSEKNLGAQNAGRYTEKLLKNSKQSHQMYVVIMKAGNMLTKQTFFF